MQQSSFQTPTWYKALTLSERTASLRMASGSTGNANINDDRARRRLQRWRSQTPFTTQSLFAQRLAAAGLTEESLLYLLGEPLETLHERSRFIQPPTWLAHLDQAFASPFRSIVETLPLPDTLRQRKDIGLLDVVAPLIQQGYDRLCAGVRALGQAHPHLGLDPQTVPSLFFAPVPEQLLEMLSRTMVLEMHVARLQGLLQGETSEERFQSFLNSIRQPEIAQALLQQYPVLARQLTTAIDQWVAASLEFLERLCADWNAIKATFSPEDDLGVLVAADHNLSDRHRGGRSVIVARFSSGLQLVYKPKSLSVDVHFQQLLTWLNERSSVASFRTLNILDRGTYGWTEFVRAQTCTSTEEIQTFYQRLGGYLALFYVLEATDFHFENLIAAGDQPVMIDLEALFHSWVQGNTIQQPNRIINQLLRSSVLRVGLLPQRMWANKESEGVDVSGLGAESGQLSPGTIPLWDDTGTDQMRITRQRTLMGGGQHRPTLNGADVQTLDYAEDFMDGFSRMYQLLLEQRSAFLAEDGPLCWFEQDEVRVILRPTQIYQLLLREGCHPDVLRDALDRDRFWDRLWHEVQRSPVLAKAIPFEYADLQQGDIPMFTTRPGSSDLWSSKHERIPDIFDEPAMTRARKRFEQLSEEDLAQQRWFIRASLASLTKLTQHEHTRNYEEACPVVDRKELLVSARAIGDRLKKLALRRGPDIFWMGLTLSNQRFWSIAPVGIDLYDGLPGITLFLAHLGAITGEEEYTEFAHASLTALQRQVAARQLNLTSIGAFDGWGGIIYVLTHLGAIWNDPELLHEAESVLDRLPALIEQDTSLDFTTGAAGCIASLLSLHQYAPSLRALSLAIHCGDRLIDQALSMDSGIGWLTLPTEAKPLAGLAHGAAGIAAALLELSAVTGAARFRTAALSAISYERSLFDAALGNWRDLREQLAQAINGGRELSTVAWCYGAPGVGLARLRSLRYLDDPETRIEIQNALKTTLARGFGANHSLCHGDLGNLELLLQARSVPGFSEWNQQLNSMAAKIVNNINKHGWKCAVPLGIESPGLMTGLAGIGYGLLRLAEPTAVPSVLLLAPAIEYT